LELLDSDLENQNTEDEYKNIIKKHSI